MKGIVFNLLESIVTEHHGEEAWDQLLDDAGTDGVYTSLGNYPDAEFFALVRAAQPLTGADEPGVVRWLGRESLPLLAARYPDFFAPHDDARSFTLTLNEIIHPEVRKLYPGADVPDFGFDASDPERLVMDYRSPRKMCAFAEGLLQGAAGLYRQSVSIEQPECMLRGDTRCRLVIAFGAAAER